ncbi:MAG TPA: CehA/McbA family metallohydrolase [Rhizomicrobium sp.]
MRLHHLILLFLVCTIGVARADPERPPDVVLKGSISGADNQTYRSLPFEVPSGIGRITIAFSYTGREQHTTIDIGLFDNERFRGWSGGNKARFTLSETDATPSYLPGPIGAGTWQLQLGIPNIRKDAHSDYEADIWFDKIDAAPAVSAFSDAPLKTGPAWYRGDLHMHTAQSDGECVSQSGAKVPCPLYKTVEAAAARGLDFIAISDHNATSQFNEERELQPTFDRLLLLPGREITTFYGHANVFGTTGFIDFRLGSEQMPDFNAMLTRIAALGGVVSINHPSSPSGEICMGCGWSAPNTDYSRVQAIEVMNGGLTAALGGLVESPISGIPFWEALLNKGFRLTAIGGSDNHEGPSSKAPIVGVPVTGVYADDLSDRAILNAIRKGRAFVDTTGATTSLLELNSRRAMMGDTIRVRAHERVPFTVHVAGVLGNVISIVEDGQKITPLDDATIGFADERKTFVLTLDGMRHWLRADVRDAKGRLLLIGNPIFVNY